jgi:hypothetical protein
LANSRIGRFKDFIEDELFKDSKGYWVTETFKLLKKGNARLYGISAKTWKIFKERALNSYNAISVKFNAISAVPGKRGRGKPPNELGEAV